MGGKYDATVNRESAFEILGKKTLEKEAALETKQAATEKSAESGNLLKDWIFGTGRRQGMLETMAKQAARTVGNQIGKRILRGVLGGITGGSGKR